MKFVLIIILNVGAYNRPDNQAVTFQEFDSKIQCEYAAQIIRQNTDKLRLAGCVNKG